MLSGHLHLLIWQETQTDGKKQAFLEHLPSAMLHEGCFSPRLIQVSYWTAKERMTSSVYI